MKSSISPAGRRGGAARAALLVGGLLTMSVIGAGPALAEAAANASAPSPAGGYELQVGQSKSQVLEVQGPYTDLMIADPRVADVVPLTTHSVYVVGKGMGATALTIYGPGKRLIAAVNVVVGADIDGFKSRLHDLVPDEKDVAVHAANQSMVVSGTVGSPAAMW